jgi:D-3-phosphoglycerate dehydrogenase
VAELVIGLSIMLIRRIPDKNKAAHEGIWLKDSKGSYELRGKTLGIIGYGNIGSQVSVLAEALGMKVIFYDAETKLPLGNATDGKTLKDVLGKSDVVTMHVPETSQTKNLINKTTLKYFKKGSILINYARGEVVDLDALAKSLEEGHLSGAAIDVFPWEPEKNGDRFKTPLQDLPNVILTPHIGGSTEEAQQNIGEDVSIKLFNYLEKGITFGSHTVPALALPPQEGSHRILHIHNNVPGVLSAINTQLSKHNINIVGQYLKTNEEIGYVVLDVDKKLSTQALGLLKEVVLITLIWFYHVVIFHFEIFIPQRHQGHREQNFVRFVSWWDTENLPGINQFISFHHLLYNIQSANGIIRVSFPVQARIHYTSVLFSYGGFCFLQSLW